MDRILTLGWKKSLVCVILKDSSIQVLFDYKYMDDSSLYFTEKEMQKLIENGTADESCLPEILDGNTIYRGYKKDGFTYFKNVTIRNNKAEKIINDCFLPPVFENNNILSIKADKWSQGKNPYACETTYDKIFALSVQEATTKAYGYFEDYDWEKWGRTLHTSDYAKAKGVYENGDSDNSGWGSYGCNWLLRSPRDINGVQMWRVSNKSDINPDEYVDNEYEGVMPVLCLN